MRLQIGLLSFSRKGQGTVRRKPRMCAESRRRRIEKGATGARQCAHLRRAIAGHVPRCGAACAVVSRVRFAFKDHHLSIPRQPIRSGCPGNASADHKEVCLQPAHTAHPATYYGSIREHDTCRISVWPDLWAHFRGVLPCDFPSERNGAHETPLWVADAAFSTKNANAIPHLSWRGQFWAFWVPIESANDLSGASIPATLVLLRPPLSGAGHVQQRRQDTSALCFGI